MTLNGTIDFLLRVGFEKSNFLHKNWFGGLVFIFFIYYIINHSRYHHNKSLLAGVFDGKLSKTPLPIK